MVEDSDPSGALGGSVKGANLGAGGGTEASKLTEGRGSGGPRAENDCGMGYGEECRCWKIGNGMRGGCVSCKDRGSES